MGNEKYIKVNVQDKVEKADELEKSFPEFDEITPSSQIPERKESVNVGIYDGVEITEIFDSSEPEMDKGMSSKIPDRKESLTVTAAEEQILSTKPYKGKIDEQLSENIKLKPVEDRKENVLVIDTKNDNVRGVSNLEVDSSGADSTQILPNLSKEKRRSVSVTRQQKVET